MELSQAEQWLKLLLIPIFQKEYESQDGKLRKTNDLCL